MKFRYRFLSISFFVLILSNAAFSQGIIQGFVQDSVTNDALPGANVLFVGTSLGASTDLNGRYKITEVPVGQYKIRVSYIGYGTKTLDVSIKGKEITVLDFLLAPQEVRGKEVIVTAQAKGQLAAINQQVRAVTIMNIVSEEKIQELPDANAAEAIGRLPGVSIIRSGGEATGVVLRGLSSKFSNITVDGVTIPGTDSTSRDVDLSMISQGSLAGIELYKALLPDQDGDAIAGTINLVTKGAPSERLVRFDLKGDYNRLMNSAGQYDFSGRYGERFFDNVLGVQLQGNLESKIRSKENTSWSYQTSKNQQLPNYDPLGLDNDYYIAPFTVAFTDETRKRNGGQAIFDINTPDSGVVKVSGLYDGTTRNILVHSRVYPGGAPGAVWDYDYRYTDQGISTLNGSAQGKNFLAGFKVDWVASYAHSRVTNPFDYELKFTEVPGVLPGAEVPQLKTDPQDYAQFAANDYSAASCSSAVYYQRQNFEKERAAALNVSRDYVLGDLFSGELKLGGKYTDVARSFDNSEYDDNAYLHGFYPTNIDGSAIDLTGTRFQSYYQNRSAYSPSLSDFVDLPAQSRNLLGLYPMSPLIDENAMKQWYDLNKNGQYGASLEYNPNAQATLNEYDVRQGVSAAYIMNTLNFGEEATLIAGVRVEKENDDYNAKFSPGGLQTIGTIVSAPSGIVDTTATHAETIWLPNGQLIIRPTDFLSVRLAAYRALARPDYNYRLPQFVLGTGGNLGGGGIPLVLGNPNLEDAKAWNFEINTQVYTNTIGLFSISAYYKKIDNFFHLMSGENISQGFDSLLSAVGTTWQNAEPFKSLIAKNNNYSLYVPYNSDRPTYVWGLEFEHQINFSFLPGFLKNITLSYNLSIARSQTYVIASQTGIDTVTVLVRGVPHRQAETYSYAVEEKRQSEDQPTLFGNAAIGYDIGGFSARLSVFYQGDYVQQYTPLSQNDIHVDPFTKLDIALRQQLTSTFALFLNIDNLTNTEEGTSRVDIPMNWHLTNTQELYGTSAEFGVRVSL